MAKRTPSDLPFRSPYRHGFFRVAGCVPLILGSGPGSETRAVIGIVVFAGVLAAAAFTLLVIPVAYRLIAGRAGSTLATSQQLDRELASDTAAPEAASGG